MSVYELITNDLIALLEGGVVPWERPWNGADMCPANLISRKPYRGINPWLLNGSGYASPYWLTFAQAKQLGGSVRKGEKGRRIVFWQINDRTEESEETADRRVILRYYTVFNVAQVDGIDAHVPTAATTAHDPIVAAEAIITGYTGPSIDWTSAGAWYRPSTDHVSMPPRETFRSAEACYATLFHELGHSTGHPSRLNRAGIGDVAPFGSAVYSREELIAEMTSAFLCGHAGIFDTQRANAAAYLHGWITALKGDSKLLISAASGAQKAADLILGVSL